MLFQPVVGEPLPVHPRYASDTTARDYWRGSFRGGRAYRRDTRDADGDALIQQHESESPEAYSRRVKTTTPREYVGPILGRYNSYVFKDDPTVPQDGANVDAFIEDVDGLGTRVIDYARRRLLTAQVDRESYILVDTTAPQAAERTLAQARASGDRFVWRSVDADRVPWWHERNGELLAAVYLDYIDDALVAVYVDAEIRQVVRVDGKSPAMEVLSVDEPVAHGYSAMPLVRLRPSFDEIGGGTTESQASPIADSQLAIYNLLSLLAEELYANTYTQWVATGINPDDAKAAGVEFGAKRLFCVPNPQASVQRIGSDPAQAESLRISIRDEELSLWRAAGVQVTDSGSTESGIARAFKHADLSAILSSLAAATQEAVNKALRITFGADVGAVKMPTDYEPSDFATELGELQSALSILDMPPSVRQHVVKRFVQRNLELDADESEQFEAEISTVGMRPTLSVQGMT